ncbi:MAG: lytic transglycosylase domain-containing protein, partial [Novosphingobium sp.]
MSSMLRVSSLLLTVSLASLGMPACGEDGREWDIALARSMQSHDLAVHQSIDRWRRLIASDRLGFSAYASFLLTY